MGQCCGAGEKEISHSGSLFVTGCRVKLEGKTEIRHIKF